MQTLSALASANSPMPFWRTVTMDSLSTDLAIERWTADEEPIARRLDQWLVGTIEDGFPEAFFDDLTATLTIHRSFFATKAGRIGAIDARDVQAGDVVAIVAGASAPLLLCRVPHTEPTEFQLVGGCYCDGTSPLMPSSNLQIHLADLCKVSWMAKLSEK